MEDKLVDFLALSGFFLGIFGFSMVLYSVILRFAHTLGIRDKDTVTRWDTASKPALGGIIFYIAFLLSIVYRYIIYGDQASLSSLAYLGSLSAVSLAFIMGLADDAYNTRPLLKFGIQLLCGVILLNTGTMIP